MGDMISLADRRRRTVERAEAVARVVEHLGELHDTVIRAGMGLILQGVFAGPRDGPPDITLIGTGRDAFRGCDDPVAELLGALAGRTREDVAAIEALESKGRPRS